MGVKFVNIILDLSNFRHGSRYYTLAPDMYVRSTVWLAMARINKILTPKVHKPQDNLNVEKKITIGEGLKKSREFSLTGGDFVKYWVK